MDSIIETISVRQNGNSAVFSITTTMKKRFGRIRQDEVFVFVIDKYITIPGPVRLYLKPRRMKTDREATLATVAMLRRGNSHGVAIPAVVKEFYDLQMLDRVRVVMHIEGDNKRMYFEKIEIEEINEKKA